MEAIEQPKNIPDIVGTSINTSSIQVDAPQVHRLYRTVPCKTAVLKQECINSKCAFAHSVSELRFLECSKDCSYKYCKFRHSYETEDECRQRNNYDLPTEPIKEKKFVRTKPCHNVLRENETEFGVCQLPTCDYAHSLDELCPPKCIFGIQCKYKGGKLHPVLLTIDSTTKCKYLHPDETEEQWIKRANIIPPRLPPTSEKSRDPQPLVVQHEPLPISVQPEPLPLVVQPEPLPLVVQPEPLPLVVQHEPQPLAVHPEPLPIAVQPEPLPQLPPRTYQYQKPLPQPNPYLQYQKPLPQPNPYLQYQKPLPQLPPRTYQPQYQYQQPLPQLPPRPYQPQYQQPLPQIPLRAYQAQAQYPHLQPQYSQVESYTHVPEPDNYKETETTQIIKVPKSLVEMALKESFSRGMYNVTVIGY
jgi:hypothetical protein